MATPLLSFTHFIYKSIEFSDPKKIFYHMGEPWFITGPVRWGALALNPGIQRAPNFSLKFYTTFRAEPKMGPQKKCGTRPLAVFFHVLRFIGPTEYRGVAGVSGAPGKITNFCPSFKNFCCFPTLRDLFFLVVRTTSEYLVSYLLYNFKIHNFTSK